VQELFTINKKKVLFQIETHTHTEGLKKLVAKLETLLVIANATCSSAQFFKKFHLVLSHP